LDSESPMGVIYVGDLTQSKESDFYTSFLSRMKGFCRRHQTAVWFISGSLLNESTVSEVKETMGQWCHSNSLDGTVSLCTIREYAFLFFDFLLDVIMSLEACSCLKAISILRERIRGG